MGELYGMYIISHLKTNGQTEVSTTFYLKSKIRSAGLLLPEVSILGWGLALQGALSARWPKGCSSLGSLLEQSTGVRTGQKQTESLKLEQIYLLTFTTSYITS